MGNISFRSIWLFLWHNHRNKETILLTKVITPPPIILYRLTFATCLPFLQRQAYLLVYGPTGSRAPWPYTPVAHKKFTKSINFSNDETTLLA